MIERVPRMAWPVLIYLLLFGFSQHTYAQSQLPIVYLTLEDDARYDGKRLFARYLNQSLGRPLAGIEIALKEAKFIAAAVDVELELLEYSATNAKELSQLTRTLNAEGKHFFVIDAPAAVVAEVAENTRDADLVLFNISAYEDSLRGAQCQPHLLHIIPSQAMLNDALVQYLLARKWRKVLVLEGERPEDLTLADSFRRSAKRFGAKIVDSKTFKLGNDPRDRMQNNIALLTGGADYDVVFVADTNGEFARGVPFHTLKPRPVVGSEGMTAGAWHWSWDRHGAPQLEKRFEKQAKRPMTGTDWAAWVAVKSLLEAVVRTKATDYKTVVDYLKGDEIILDGFKGNRMNFRSWNNQLRQPILLFGHNWVIDRAPIAGFEHASNRLDTLGYDQRESLCSF